jgi:hypothetical protein
MNPSQSTHVLQRRFEPIRAKFEKKNAYKQQLVKEYGVFRHSPVTQN